MCYNLVVKTNRGVVQSVEHQSPKLGVQGSSPCAPAKKKAIRKRWCNLGIYEKQ